MNLSHLIASVAKQTITPAVWVIVDDGSVDDTPNIIEKATIKYNWIKCIHIESVGRDLGLHLSTITKEGFDVAERYCTDNRIEYSFVGKIDGDMVLPSYFFKHLIREFEIDHSLGVAGGGTDNLIGNRIVPANMMSLDEPSGGNMLMRKECFRDCGGFPLTLATDAVIKAKARIKGWKTKRFEEIRSMEARDVSAAEGYWKGLEHVGEISYYLCHHPLHVLYWTLVYLFKRPHYTAIAYLFGYFRSVLGGKERIEDLEMREYFKNKWRDKLKFNNYY